MPNEQAYKYIHQKENALEFCRVFPLECFLLRLGLFFVLKCFGVKVLALASFGQLCLYIYVFTCLSLSRPKSSAILQKSR